LTAEQPLHHKAEYDHPAIRKPLFVNPEPAASATHEPDTVSHYRLRPAYDAQDAANRLAANKALPAIMK
jgi:hypothetical protein